MDPERWQRLRTLYDQALELPVAERDRFLEQSCSEDSELRDQLGRLLGTAVSDRFLAAPRIPMEPEPGVGDLVGDDFEILERIGHGGMGVVFRARQRSLDRDVALKILPWSKSLDLATVQRFEREARSVARLQHPGIVPVYVVGVHRDAPYFAMELLPRGDLAAALRQFRNKSAQQSLQPSIPRPGSSEYLGWVSQRIADLASALQHAHDSGIVHRDVKPQNILLTDSGALKLSDFGIAKDQRLGTLSGKTLTAGTPEYMSPEQAHLVEAPVDHRTDVYSLGVVLYELLTLSLPFPGKTTQEILRRIAKDFPRDVRSLNPRVPRDLATVTHKALARDPRQRYAKVQEMEGDLRRFLRHEAILAHPPTLVERSRRWLKRHRFAAALCLLTLTALAAGFVGSTRLAQQRRIEAAFQRWEDLAVEDLPLENGSLERLDPDRRRELRTVWRSLSSLSGRLNLAQRDRVRNLELAFASFRDQQLEFLRAEFEECSAPGGEEGSKRFRLADASLRAGELHALFYDDPAVQAFANDSMAPLVSLAAADPLGSPIAARAWYRPIDSVTGQPGTAVDLGALPTELRLPPRRYRFVVRFEQGAGREFTRDLFQDTDLRLVAQLRSDEDSVTTDMVRIEAAIYRFADDPRVREDRRDRAIPVESFWIDRTEVSNGQYQRFLEAMDQRGMSIPRPRYWDGERPERWADLPVVGVRWVECRAFAEWSGKRLITSTEWLLAAQGTEHRDFPWGEGDENTLRRANVGKGLLGMDSPSRFSIQFQTDEARREEYLQNAAVVHSYPDGATPQGVLHLFGNVREFTEDNAVIRYQGLDHPYALERWVMGKDWQADPARAELDCIDYNRIDFRSSLWLLGFRCARSDDL